MNALLTEAEHADGLVTTTRRTAWVLLAAATATSLAGNVWHAHRYGSGSTAAMAAAAVVPLLLLLAMHLVGGLAAARRAGRVHPTVHRAAVVGVGGLAVMTLAASFLSLRDLLLREHFDPAAAVLIPAAVDVAVVVSTTALFSIAPRLRGAAPRRAAAPAAPPAASASSPAAAARSAPSPAAPAASAPTSAAAPRTPPDVVAAVEAAIAAGGSDRGIAADLGVSARTVSRIRRAAEPAAAPVTTPALAAVR